MKKIYQQVSLQEFSKEKKQEKLNENNFDENARSEFLKGARNCL